MFMEMTERMEMITQSKNDLQTTYNCIPMFLIEVGSDYKVLNVNETLCQFIDRKSHQLIGESIDFCLQFSNEITEVMKNSIQETLSTNRNHKTELKINGRIFECFTFPMQETTSKRNRVLLMLNDVTHMRAMYRQSLQDNKMTAVGHLAAGVAHEIRNPLGLIRNYCHLLKKNLSWNEKQKLDAFFMMEQAVERSSKIIDNLLRFSRVSSEKWTHVNLKQTLIAILSFEEHTLEKRHIQGRIICDERIMIPIVLESFEMIMVNLIINSMDAMANGGELIIKCTKEADMVTIKASDTGTGIPEEIVADIFNPFFTTKENRNGAGLGLYIVYNEVTKLNGKIFADSEMGVGTTFTIQLPLERTDAHHGKST